VSTSQGLRDFLVNNLFLWVLSNDIIPFTFENMFVSGIVSDQVLCLGWCSLVNIGILEVLASGDTSQGDV